MEDPLRLNLQRQTTKLLEKLGPESVHAATISTATTNATLLTVLSRLLALPTLTLTVAGLYRPLLFDLCARWIDEPENSVDQLVALCLLLEPHQELFPCVFLFFKAQNSI